MLESSGRRSAAAPAHGEAADRGSEEGAGSAEDEAQVSQTGEAEGCGAEEETEGTAASR